MSAKLTPSRRLPEMAEAHTVYAMLSTYIARAMEHATYEITEDGRYFGSIPATPGVWSEAVSLEKCREELREVLEEWIVLALKRGEPLPVIDACDLNRVAQHA